MGNPISVDGQSVGIVCMFYISSHNKEEAVKISNIEHFCEMCGTILKSEAEKQN